MYSLAYRRYALTTVTAVYMLNLVDRGLMSLLLQPIKEDLQLSDTQLGFLTGIAFALFYATLGLPIARWSDRSNRANIAALAIALWGITVMACVLVTTYAQMVVARVLAAVGEAGCKPPTYSLVGDYFPQPAERTRAMAFYMTGNYLSMPLAFIVGGWLNELYGWRLTFFLMGIPGLILAVIVRLTIRDPRFAASDARSSIPLSLPPMRSVLKLLWKSGACRNLTFALVLLYMMGAGLGPWYAAYMIRSHGMGTAELGLWLGAITGIGGIAGVLVGGYVAGRWFGENEQGQMRISASAVMLFVPCFVMFLMAPNKHWALVALAPTIMIASVFVGPTYSLMQRLVPDQMRATMLSLIMLLANLIGFGIGPQLVGILSDVFTRIHGPDGLRYAMLLMSLVALWSGYHFWAVGRTVKADLMSVQAETERQ